MRTALALATGVAAIAILCALSPGSATAADGLSPLPSAEELAPDTVAFVSYVPARISTVSAPELHRAIAQAAFNFGLKAAPAPEHPKYKRVVDSALENLLDSIWIEGQAAEMRIAVTPGEVAAEYRAIKARNFKTGREFHTFLEQSHLTVSEALGRVRLQLLSGRMQERVVRRAQKRREGVQHAFVVFVKAYLERWRGRTVCSAQYAIEHCSNGPPLQPLFATRLPR